MKLGNRTLAAIHLIADGVAGMVWVLSLVPAPGAACASMLLLVSGVIACGVPVVFVLQGRSSAENKASRSRGSRVLLRMSGFALAISWLYSLLLIAVVVFPEWFKHGSV